MTNKLKSLSDLSAYDYPAACPIFLLNERARNLRTLRCEYYNT